MRWPTKKLGDVCEIVTGATPKTSINGYFGGGILWAGPSDLGVDTYITKTRKTLTENGVEKGGVRLIPKDSVMVSCIGYIGKIGVAGERMATNQQINTFFPSTKTLDSKFLYHALVYKTEDFRRLSSQTTLPIINKGHCATIEIPLPPIDEQKRIVAKLENLLGKVKEAKRLRAEAQAATANLLPAELHKELFGKKWKTTKLLELLERINNVDAKTFPTEEFDYVDISSVAAGKGIFTHKVYSRMTAPSRARRPIKENDVIFALTRPYLRNIAFVEKEYDSAIASTGFAVLRSKHSELDPKFLYYVVSSDWFVEKVLPFQRGATYPAINESDILVQDIPLPPLSEQKKIVARLDSLSEKIRQLQDYQKQTVLDLDALEKSILHQAFEGKL